MNQIDLQSAELLDRFIASRESSTPLPVADFLRDHSAQLDRDAQLQVVLFDQAHRATAESVPDVEFYLSISPWIRSDTEALVDLLYGDWRARSARGIIASLEPLFARYPQAAEQLKRQVSLGDWLSKAAERDVPSDVALADETLSVALSSEPSPRDETDSTPLPISDFTIGRRLGIGGMGEVYEAEQISLGRMVALKIIRPNLVNHPQIRARFVREARIIARLRHPHIAAVYGIGRTSDGGLFIAMELVRGTSLDDRLSQGPTSITEAVRIFHDIAEAVSHAHEAGVVHRDLKPSNILIEPDGRVVVVDFGLARINAVVDPALSTPSQVLGTPQYLAPEVIDSSLGEPGVGVDVYGLGCLLYVLLTGKPPLSAGSAGELLRLAVMQNPVSPRESRAEIPAALADACLRSLRKRPAERFSGAAEFAAAVRDAVNVEENTDDRAPHGMQSSWRFKRVLAVAAAVCLLISALQSFFGPAPPIEATWNVDLFPQGVFERKVALVQAPKQAAPGDGLRIRLSLSRPGYAYLFWIDSDGAWVPLYPAADRAAEATSIVEMPNDPTSVLPLSGTPEWDACVAVVRDTPAPSDFDWKTGLAPIRGLRWSDTPLLVDDQPLRSAESNEERTARERLAGDSRTVEAARTLDFEHALQAWKQWRTARSAAIAPGQLHYFVMRRSAD